MTALSRTITSSILEWRGILISITFEKQRFVDHIQVETLEPSRAPLPITATGYRSHFIAKHAIEDGAAAADYVETWLNHEARHRGWVEQEASIRQYALL